MKLEEKPSTEEANASKMRGAFTLEALERTISTWINLRKRESKKRDREEDNEEMRKSEEKYLLVD